MGKDILERIKSLNLGLLSKKPFKIIKLFESSSEDLQDVLFTHDLSSIIISDAHYINILLNYIINKNKC